MISRGGIYDGDPSIRLRSAPTVARLVSLWQSPDESEDVRRSAFWYWLQSTGCTDLGMLLKVEPSNSFYDLAVQHRIKINDPSVVPELLQLLRSDNLHGWWWVLAHRVWCGELRSYASEVLAEACGHIPTDFSGGWGDLLHTLAELLVKIPVADAEGMLQNHWGHLKYSPWMIQTAFRIGTSVCVDLIMDALSLCPTTVDVFHLAFSTVWEQENAANPITLKHLELLEPYLDRIRPKEFLFLAWRTERVAGADERIAEWLRRHVIPRLEPEDQIRVQVADEMLIGNLDRCFKETGFPPYLAFLFEERHGFRYVVPERQLALLDRWLSNHRTVRGLLIAAECLVHIGARKDLTLLDRYPIEGDAASMERIKADARFSVYRRTLV